MAGELQRADESQRGNRAWRRDWFSYEQYLVVHQSSLDSLEAEGLIHRDRLTFREVRQEGGGLRAVNVRGRLECSDNIVISVNKWLDVGLNDRNQIVVKGRWYSYHAWVRAKPRRDLLRYDNGEGEDRLHRHFFDDDGKQIAVQPVSYDSLPRLDLVVREAVALARGMPIEHIYR